MQRSHELITVTLCHLVPDVIQRIADRLDFLSQVSLRLVAQFFAIHCPITNLMSCRPRMTIQFSSIPMVTKLSVTRPVSQIGHLRSLRILSAMFDCGIGDDQLQGLINLTSLNISHNSSVTKLNHLTNLRWLMINSFCGVNDAGIAQLTGLRSLHAYNNQTITTVNHLTQLRTLDASYRCGIEGLSQLTQLTVLTITGNPRVTQIGKRVDQSQAAVHRSPTQSGGTGTIGANDAAGAIGTGLEPIDPECQPFDPVEATVSGRILDARPLQFIHAVSSDRFKSES